MRMFKRIGVVYNLVWCGNMSSVCQNYSENIDIDEVIDKNPCAVVSFY